MSPFLALLGGALRRVKDTEPDPEAARGLPGPSPVSDKGCRAFGRRIICATGLVPRSGSYRNRRALDHGPTGNLATHRKPTGRPRRESTPSPEPSAAPSSDAGGSDDLGDVVLTNAGALAPHGTSEHQTLVGAEQVAEEVAEAERARSRAYAPKTLHAYRRDWEHFAAYCADRGARALPADPLVVRTYLTVCARRLKVATLHRRIAAIAFHHRQAGHELDTNDAAFRETWRGIRRTKTVAQSRKAAAVTAEIKAMLAHLPNDTLAGLRDRALLLVGFAGAFRRSELVGLDLMDVRFEPGGLRILVRSSKTDQEGAGLQKEIPYMAHPETCPVRALRDWLEAAELTELEAVPPVFEPDPLTGELRTALPVFRPLSKSGRVLARRLSDKWVVLLVKRVARAIFAHAAEQEWEKLSARQQARHDRDEWVARHADAATARYAAHSLRAGFITTAAANGEPIHKIMEQTGHVRYETVAGYIRNARAISESAAARLGL